MAEEFARAAELAHTARFRGARFTESDLNGATFRDSELRDVRITSSAVDGMSISGFDGQAGTVVVDDVVVTDFVAAELDRRHPERVQLRAMRTADDELEEVRTGTPMPGQDADAFTVGTCLRVVLNEHCAHRRYAVRDLAALEADLTEHMKHTEHTEHTDGTTGDPG